MSTKIEAERDQMLIGLEELGWPCRLVELPGHVKELYTAIQLRDSLLKEAGELFRFYEKQHRAKNTEESTVKAERNAEIASRIEAILNAAK